MKFSVFKRRGNAHGMYVGEIEGNNAKEAFKSAIIMYFKMKEYDILTEFYVQVYDNDKGDLQKLDQWYGFSDEPLYRNGNYLRTQKWIVLEILNKEF